MSTSTPARARRFAVLATVVVGLTVGLAATPALAEPTPVNALLRISPNNATSYVVNISGRFPMSEYDAHGFINNLGTGSRVAAGLGPGGIFYRLYGDDSGSNDPTVAVTTLVPGKRMPSPQTSGYLYAASDGIHFEQQFVVSKGALNEDDGEDEIYGEAVFVDGDNGQRQVWSTVIRRSF